ncbi:head GIN domain-containing protein [Fulvivirga lutimaris]|uniref:head GIN domain-containing protein n=1 Tax=Fulvivirga lutimaris TaxID=1819566 RepID=UPI0012BD1472|nr:head GIN domain-containing protein [Fulvivirga lutimaris]MTI39549.1 DUF2807 domain-containing protein [Fulvivirga lutimaris]
MKTKITSSLFMFLLSLTLTSCYFDDIDGRGPVVKQELVLPTFESIDFQIAGEVTVIQGAEQKVLVTSQRNIIEKLNTRVVNGNWEIDLEHGRYDYDVMSITIILPNVEDIRLSGSGTITLNNFEVQNNMEFILAGSGKIIIGEVSGAAFVNAEVIGSGSIIANEPFNGLHQLDVEILGSGIFTGFQMETDVCHVDIIGSGNAQVHPNSTLEVNIDGSGSVFYKGNPSISTSITGSGRVIDSN